VNQIETLTKSDREHAILNPAAEAQSPVAVRFAATSGNGESVEDHSRTCRISIR